MAATLTLVKTISGGTSVPTDFTLFATGTVTFSGAGGFGPISAPADVYFLTESAGPGGYSQSAWSFVSDGPGTVLIGNILVLADGETVTCSITNTRTPSVYVIEPSASATAQYCPTNQGPFQPVNGGPQYSVCLQFDAVMPVRTALGVFKSLDGQTWTLMDSLNAPRTRGFGVYFKPGDTKIFIAYAESTSESDETIPIALTSFETDPGSGSADKYVPIATAGPDIFCSAGGFFYPLQTVFLSPVQLSDGSYVVTYTPLDSIPHGRRGINFATCTSGGSWGAPVIISAVANTNLFGVALRPADRVQVVYKEDDLILWAEIVAGGASSPVTVIGPLPSTGPTGNMDLQSVGLPVYFTQTDKLVIPYRDWVGQQLALLVGVYSSNVPAFSLIPIAAESSSDAGKYPALTITDDGTVLYLLAADLVSSLPGPDLWVLNLFFSSSLSASFTQQQVFGPGGSMSPPGSMESNPAMGISANALRDSSLFACQICIAPDDPFNFAAFSQGVLTGPLTPPSPPVSAPPTRPPGGGKRPVVLITPFDGCLARDYRLYKLVDRELLSCAKKPECFCTDERQWGEFGEFEDVNVGPPEGSIAFNPQGQTGLPIPSAGDVVIFQTTVPVGYDGVILGQYHQYTFIPGGKAFVEGSADIIWRLKIAGRCAKDCGSMLVSLGSQRGLSTIAGGLQVRSGNLIQYIVNAPNLSGNLVPAFGQILAGLHGYYFSRR